MNDDEWELHYNGLKLYSKELKKHAFVILTIKKCEIYMIFYLYFLNIFFQNQIYKLNYNIRYLMLSLFLASTFKKSYEKMFPFEIICIYTIVLIPFAIIMSVYFGQI